MHKLTQVSLGGRLNLAPVPSDLERILDIGTGTGIWAMEMGETLQDFPSKTRIACTDQLIICMSTGDRYENAEVRISPVRYCFAQAN